MLICIEAPAGQIASFVVAMASSVVTLKAQPALGRDD